DGGSGSPLLLLHGFPATRTLWRETAPGLRALGFRVLVPDLIGYGESTAAARARIDMASQAKWMLELLDRLGVERAVVIAHDVGSAAAQLMLATAPARVRALVVLDGVYGREWAMSAIDSIRDWEERDAERLLPVLMRRLGKGPGMRDMLASYAGHAGGLALIRAARDLDPTQTEHIDAALAAAGVPARVIWGEHDPFLSIASVARPLAQLLRAQLVIVPGGHFTPLDCPAEVLGALRDFLAALP
ncbi:MAG TPA: alpha/beta hydrolase, partial [Candidatus Dormibacteraeota bacterium]|nr:alpha/beta hydrolase [Candidatus Dormibacteraeota bacterium]